MSDSPPPTTPRDPLADARLAAIVESSSDAIIGKDLNSIILSWNRGAERLFGYTAEEAIGRAIFMLIPDALHGEEAEIIGRITRGERLESYETVRRRKDGSEVEISITVSPIRDPSGRIVGASKVARDITAARESERRIAVLLQEVNHRVKNQFAVMLSILNEVGKTAPSVAEFQKAVRGRVMGLARSQDLLVSAQWGGVDLRALVEHQLDAFGRPERIRRSGPPVQLEPMAVQYLGMALHELGTNSAKYGALQGEEGEIDVTWALDRESNAFAFAWRERAPGILPPDEAGERVGFGSTVLDRVTPLAMQGTAVRRRVAGELIWSLNSPADIALGRKP